MLADTISDLVACVEDVRSGEYFDDKERRAS